VKVERLTGQTVKPTSAPRAVPPESAFRLTVIQHAPAPRVPVSTPKALRRESRTTAAKKPFRSRAEWKLWFAEPSLRAAAHKRAHLTSSYRRLPARVPPRAT